MEFLILNKVVVFSFLALYLVFFNQKIKNNE